MRSPSESFAGNIERFTGFADLYDRFRAGPPTVLATLVANYTGHARPALVIDLGSGTGLSTRFWAQHAERVIGIEPTADMRHVAEAATRAKNVSYQEGFSHATGLPERCAQAVCCMQALHWMEPQSTFTEAARVLVPGGVFLACDYDWPPSTGSWEAEAAWEAVHRQARELERTRNTAADVRHWPKSGHLERMAASGCFRFTTEIMVHQADEGNAERLVGLMESQGFVAALRKSGATDAEIGINVLRAVAERTLGTKLRSWLWSARVRLGVV